MQQTYYEKCGLMLIQYERKSRLYRVEKSDDNTLKLLPMRYLSADHTYIKVYPQHNIVVTSRVIYTLDEQTIISRLGAEVQVYSFGSSAIMVLDYKRNCDTRYCIVWWNGKQKYAFAFGNRLILTKKYLALYTRRDEYWNIYTVGGALALETECRDDHNIEIYGDFMIVHSVGNHTLYSLKQHHRYTIQGATLFEKKQLILCSKNYDFAICSDLSGVIQSYYRGTYSAFERADNIQIFDTAAIFCLKRGNKFMLYRYNGQPFGEDLRLHTVDFVSCSEEQKELLLGIGDKYHLLKF